MTHTLIDHADSGEIPRIDDLGTEPTRDLAHHLRRDTTGEKTENLGQYFRPDAPFPHLRQVIEIDDTVVYSTSRVIGMGDLTEGWTTIDGDLAGPQSPPPPLPPQPRPSVPPRYDLAAAQPVAPWERVADTEQVTILGSLGADLPDVPFPPLRPEVPHDGRARFEVRRMFRAGRHAAPARPWAWLLAGVVIGAVGFYAGQVLAAVAVIR